MAQARTTRSHLADRPGKVSRAATSITTIQFSRRREIEVEGIWRDFVRTVRLFWNWESSLKFESDDEQAARDDRIYIVVSDE
jgi:hypothetical protein